MRMCYFGDSYDIVKKFLIHSLAPDAEWVVFPMFSHQVKSGDIQAFEEFLGIQVISKSVITKDNRIDSLASLGHYQHIFIDPDIGISLKPSNSVKHISGPELVNICHEGRNRLLLVFDQSFNRGKMDEEIAEKLSYFKKQNIYGFTYRSHACFVVLSASKAAYKNAYNRLLGSGLPRKRLILGNT